MKVSISFVLALFSIGFTACWSAETPDAANQSNASNVLNKPIVVNETNAANSTAEINRPSETPFVKPSVSPTETLKALSAASKAKNTEAVKNVLSNNAIALIQKSAVNQSKSLDELLKSDAGALFVPLPELGREEISGDTATVEIKNEKGIFVKVPFVLEDGKWKVAVDKFLFE